jgi:uncharacterized membrane protein
MKALNDFLKTTLFGGLVFLVPVILLLLVLRQALEFAGKLARPMVTLVPGGALGGIAVGTMMAVLMLVALAFIAGLVARTGAGRRLTLWFEESILGGLPQYQMAKTMAEGFARIESDTAQMQPALVLIDGGWQLAYRLEDLADGWVAVFVPQSPTPMSGNVMFVEAPRVRRLPIPMRDAVVLVKRLGIGSALALQGVTLGPAEAGVAERAALT